MFRPSPWLSTWLVLACLSLLAVPGMAAPAAGTSDPGARARAILEAGDYQTELPDELATVHVPGAGRIGTAMFWLLGLLVVALCIWFLANELGLGADASLDRSLVGAVDDDGRTSSASLEDSDRLAASGRFDEAIHVLLLVAIRSLSAESGSDPRPSSTARELVRTFGLEGERRRAFADLVRAVELSLFGGRPVAEDDYARCRNTYRTLVTA